MSHGSICLVYRPERIWLTPEQPLPDREHDVTESLKLMLAVTWNRSGFHVVITLPKGLKFNAGYYIYATEMLERIKNLWKEQGAGSTQKLIVHADNARLIRPSCQWISWTPTG
jgi:hypothetical protein